MHVIRFKFLPKSKLENLPKKTGIYCFLEKTADIGSPLLYIGKAINIKNRVKNHFFQPSYRDKFFIEKVDKIGFIETNSEITALILEANLIKKFQPKFNVVWRDDKNYFYVAIAKNSAKIPYIFITHQPQTNSNFKFQISNSRYIGPFVEGTALKKTLKFLRKVFPYYTAKTHPKRKCTYCHLDLCPGPNPDLKLYNKNIKNLINILQGKSNFVLNSLKKEMQILAKNKDFENAGKIRDKIFALEKIMSHVNVIEDTKFYNQNSWQNTEIILQKTLNINKKVSRIECYDISNIQGKFATGSMIVFKNGEAEKKEYKKFKIKFLDTPNDIAMLKEVLERRFSHKNWQYPEIILIDGGIAQLNIAKKIKNNLKIKNLKIIAIAKGRQQLFIEERKEPIPLKNLPQDIYNLIKNLDNEAHRFAITYHKKLRKKNLLKD